MYVIILSKNSKKSVKKHLNVDIVSNYKPVIDNSKIKRQPVIKNIKTGNFKFFSRILYF